MDRIKKIFFFIVLSLVVAISFILGNSLFLYLSPTEYNPDYKLPGKVVNMNGRNIHYIERGRGIPVILIHDIGYSAEYFEDLIDLLSDNFHVYAIDLIGHGFSEKPKDVRYDANTYIKFLKRFMDFIGLYKVNILAHGNSSVIINEFLKKYPDRAYKTVFLSGNAADTFFYYDELIQYPLIGESIVNLIDRRTIRKNFKDKGFYNPLIIDAKDIDTIAKYWGIPGTRQTYIRTARSLKKLLEGKKNIVLYDRGIVIGTEKSYNVSGKHNIEQNSSWQYKELKEVGYFSFIEKPVLVSKEITKYFTY